MSHQSPAIACPHEIRAGTAVCLYCRREARAAARLRLRRQGARLACIVVVLAVIAAAIPGGATVLQGLRPADSSGAWAARAVARRERRPLSATLATASAARPTRIAQPWRDFGRGMAPTIPEGRSVLRGGIVATRAGDTVTVRFDQPGVRTRRTDKFERVVRATLPLVYGRAADSLLARTPPGSLATPGTLLTELPLRGIRLPLADGSSLMLWPGLRPWSGGPLVVMYRAYVVR